METRTKSGLYVPKRGRGLAGTQTAQMAVKPDSPANEGQSVTQEAPSPPLLKTQTQIANRIFRQRAKKIPDTEIEVRTGENEGEPIYVILVPEFRSEASRRIYKLQSDLYRKYPEANLNVEVRGRRELGECPISHILIS